MKVEQDGNQVTITKGNMRVTLSVPEFERRIARMTDWYSAKKGSAEYDKYHGLAARMFDPESPYPKQFTHKMCERWTPSGATNGPVMTADNALAIKISGRRK